MASISKEYSTGSYLEVSIRKEIKESGENNKDYLELFVKVEVQEKASHIITKVRKQITACLSEIFSTKAEINSFLGNGAKENKSQPALPASYDQPDIKTEISNDSNNFRNPQKSILAVSVTLRINEAAKNIFSKIDNALFEAFAGHADITEVHLQKLFWRTDEELKTRLDGRTVPKGKRRKPSKASMRSEPEKPSEQLPEEPVNWQNVENALTEGHIREAYSLIGNIQYDRDGPLDVFIRENRPINEELKSHEKKMEE